MTLNKKTKPNQTILLNKHDQYLSIVTYWPSTELSTKRCTCVNTRKNSGSRWMSDNIINRCPGRFETVGANWSHLGTRYRSESQWQTEGFGPSVTHGWATPAKMRKKCCYGQKNLGSICSSLSPSPTQEVRSFVHWSSSLCLIMFRIYSYYESTTVSTHLIPYLILTPTGVEWNTWLVERLHWYEKVRVDLK